MKVVYLHKLTPKQFLNPTPKIHYFEKKILYVIRTDIFDKNASLWWKFIIWWKLITEEKIYACNENWSILRKSIVQMKNMSLVWTFNILMKMITFMETYTFVKILDDNISLWNWDQSQSQPKLKLKFRMSLVKIC